jgi:WD40 repeat protein
MPSARIEQWDLTVTAPTLKATLTAVTNAEVTSIATSRDNRFLATMGWVPGAGGLLDISGRIALWDTVSGEQLAAAETQDVPFGVAFSNDGKYLVSSEGGVFKASRLRLWELEGNALKESRPLMGHAYWAVPFAQFTPDNSRLVSAGFDGRAIVWNVASGVQLHVLELPFSNSTTAMSPDGRYLATGYRTGPVYIVRLNH